MLREPYTTAAVAAPQVLVHFWRPLRQRRLRIHAVVHSVRRYAKPHFQAEVNSRISRQQLQSGKDHLNALESGSVSLSKA